MWINAEWESLKEVIMHRPGPEIEYAMLAPKPFLFERPFRSREALLEHEGLENTLRNNGIKVSILKDLVLDTADSDHDFRKILEEKVSNTVRFYGTVETTAMMKEELAKNLNILDSSTLFNTMILEPSIDIKKINESDPGYPTIYSNLPLANLYFMRDQQAVSHNGIMIGNMKMSQRTRETELTDFIFSNKFGKENTRRISGNSKFEGGDYIPMGKFGLIGTGPRTNIEGAKDFIRSGISEHDEILVVENPLYDFQEKQIRGSMVNMHLDTYFNVASDGVAIASIRLSKLAKGKIFSRLSKNEYEATSETTLYKFLQEKGFEFMDLSVSEQISYSSNFLTLGNGKILCIDSELVLNKLINNSFLEIGMEDVIKNEISKQEKEKLFPNAAKMASFNIDYITVDLSELTGGYGGAHCMTASIKRG
ncbi:MAG: arginine deiminase family protein [Thermoplasmataceae archaeon]